MYDLPGLGWAHDALCDRLLSLLIESGGLTVSDGLSPSDGPGAAGLPLHRERPGDLIAAWLDPDLLLSQTCGYPLITRLAGRVKLVATPCYAAEGCAGPWMRSALVVRSTEPARDLEDLRGRAICAVNSMDSNSGMNLLRAEIAPLAGGEPFFRDVLRTGAHAASMAAVQAGRADLAAIDCVTWALLGRQRPQAIAGLRVLGWTRATPGLPLITAAAMPDRGVRTLRAALDALARDPGLSEARQALLIEGFEVLEAGAYAPVRDAEQEAIALSYPVLR